MCDYSIYLIYKYDCFPISISSNKVVLYMFRMHLQIRSIHVYNIFMMIGIRRDVSRAQTNWLTGDIDCCLFSFLPPRQDSTLMQLLWASPTSADKILHTNRKYNWFPVKKHNLSCWATVYTTPFKINDINMTWNLNKSKTIALSSQPVSLSKSEWEEPWRQEEMNSTMICGEHYKDDIELNPVPFVIVVNKLMNQCHIPVCWRC